MTHGCPPTACAQEQLLRLFAFDIEAKCAGTSARTAVACLLGDARAGIRPTGDVAEAAKHAQHWDARRACRKQPPQLYEVSTSPMF